MEQENLAAARATIKRTSTMLLTSSKTYLRHPESSSARENRDFVYNELRDAVNVISSITQGQSISSTSDSSLTTVGDLTKALNEFDVNEFFCCCLNEKFPDEFILANCNGKSTKI